MRRLWLKAAAAAGIALACGASAPLAAVGQSLKVGTKTQEIRGGKIITGFPGIVELQIGAFPAGNCTGTMIAPNVILTAAHCLRRVNAANQTSGSGTFNIFYYDPAAGRRLLFSGSASWFAHQGFNWAGPVSGAGYANADIAVVKTPSRFQGTDYREYLRLYAGNNDRLKTRLDAYGAGRYTYSGKTDNNLRMHEFSVEHVKKNHIVIDTRKKVGICIGDSGGPLVYSIAYPGTPIPTVAGVASNIELSGGEGRVCTNNDLGIDDAFYSRTNWEKLSSVMEAAGVECALMSAGDVAYRRCFELPFIEDVEWEGRDQGEAVAIVISAIRG